MKKLILTTFIVLALGSFVYAQMGMGGCWSNGTQVRSSAQAENMVKSMIGNNGWTVTGSKELKLRKGTGYKVEVKNTAGSTEYYVVTPFGLVQGPVTSETADNFCNTGCGYGMNYGMGHGPMGHGYGKYHGMGHGQMNNNQAAVTTISQAEELVKQAIANLKGYTITSTDEIQVHRGNAYKVNVKDIAGNQLYYFVNPFGYIRGPLTDAAQYNN